MWRGGSPQWPDAPPQDEVLWHLSEPMHNPKVTHLAGDREGVQRRPEGLDGPC